MTKNPISNTTITAPTAAPIKTKRGKSDDLLSDRAGAASLDGEGSIVVTASISSELVVELLESLDNE